VRAHPGGAPGAVGRLRSITYAAGTEPADLRESLRSIPGKAFSSLAVPRLAKR